MQKSRFGRTVIDGKISFGGKLGPMLTLSWLVRVQFGAKRGKLMRLGGPKSVQEHSTSVPRAEKVASIVLGGLWRVVKVGSSAAFGGWWER